MKYLVTITFPVTSLFFCFASCEKNDNANNGDAIIQGDSSNNGNNNNNDTTSNKMKITVGATVFTATLYDSETAIAFKRLLPLTLNMDDFNSNEKKFDFSNSFPTNTYNPQNISTGDLMLWSGNTLVLFYKSFPTPYSYTRLSKIDNAWGLESAVGTGSVTVKFELE